jgi:chromosome segregation ATPase
MSPETGDYTKKSADLKTDAEPQGEYTNHLRPPGAAWLAMLVLVALGVFVVQVFGLKGHLSLLREKAKWNATTDEHAALVAKTAILRSECASNEVFAAVLQTNLAATMAELAAKKTEYEATAQLLRQAQIDRDTAEAEQRKAAAATNELWTVVTTLASQTNGLRLTVAALDEQCRASRQDKTGLDAQITAQNGAIDENRKALESLVNRTKTAQTDWQHVSRELEDAIQRLAAADANRSNALIRTSELEKQLAAGTLLVAGNDLRATTLQQRVTVLEGERAKNQMQVDEVGRTLIVLRDEMKKIDPLLTAAKAEQAKTQTDVTSLTKQRDDLQRRLDQLRGELTATEKTLSERRVENATMESRYAELTKRLRDERDLAVQTAQATIGASNAVSRLADLNAREGELAKSIETLQAILSRLRTDALTTQSGSTNATLPKR